MKLKKYMDSYSLGFFLSAMNRFLKGFEIFILGKQKDRPNFPSIIPIESKINKYIMENTWILIK